MHLNQRRILASPFALFVLILALCLSACSGKDDDEPRRTQAEQAGIGEVRQAPGVTVFVAQISFRLANYGDLAGVAYTVAPRPDSASKPLAVSFERSWLDRRGAWDAAAKRLALPVFGLYAAHANRVDMTATFRDGSKHTWRVDVPTGAYAGPADVYAAPSIGVARGPGRVPGFDFIFVKNGRTAPVVIDTDGQLRWTGAVLGDSISSMFGPDAFYIGSQSSPDLYRMDVDGVFSTATLGSSPAGAQWSISTMT